MRFFITKRKKRKRNRDKESGQAMIESVICIMLICLVLFGLLQIFYLSVAQMITDYSSFCAARSRAVGFDDYLVRRSAEVASIGASGDLVFPEDSSYGDNSLTQLAAERVRIREYMAGERWLEYEYWDGHGDSDTTLGTWHSSNIGTITTHVRFRNYPMDFPMRRAFTTTEELDINGESELMDYAGYYLNGGE